MMLEEYPAAESLMTRVLDHRRRTLPEGHSLTLSTMEDLANLYLRREKTEEAERMLIKLAGLFKRKYGEGHEKTRMAICFLADLYEDWGNTEKASEWRNKLEEEAPAGDGR